MVPRSVSAQVATSSAEVFSSTPRLLQREGRKAWLREAQQRLAREREAQPEQVPREHPCTA
jgi:hypothetical protein